MASWKWNTRPKGVLATCKPWLQCRDIMSTVHQAAAAMQPQQPCVVMVQIRVTAVVEVIWTLTLIAFWLVGRDGCSNWATIYLGVLPVTLATAPVVVIKLFGTEPLLPADGAAPPTVLLQDFAWTLKSRPAKLAARPAAVPAAEPMFCVETAIKAFFWATVVYDYAEADGHRFQNLPESVKALVAEVDDAMALFSLEMRRLFYDPERETVVVVAWNRSTVVVCIRGSIAPQNFADDAKVRPLFLGTAARSSSASAAASRRRTLPTMPRCGLWPRFLHPRYTDLAPILHPCDTHLAPHALFGHVCLPFVNERVLAHRPLDTVAMIRVSQHSPLHVTLSQ